jgi:hypothetical protein
MVKFNLPFFKLKFNKNMTIVGNLDLAFSYLFQILYAIQNFERFNTMATTLRANRKIQIKTLVKKKL